MTRAERRVARAALAALAVAAVLFVSACNNPPKATEVMQPKVVPPAVRRSGVLRAGVDLGYPPFAGVDGRRQAGIDIDVASAVGGRLGLKVEFVNVPASQVATAIADGDVDIAMSAPFSADVLSRATIAGTYLSDGPALFTRESSAAIITSKPLDGLDGAKVGAQRDSEAYWQLVDELGAASVAPYSSLRAALDSLAHGEIDYVGGDAIVGAYIARDEGGVRFAVPMAPAHLLGVAVAADNTKLADAVRTTLDDLAGDGALDTIRTTWVGPLPRLPLAGDRSGSLDKRASGSGLPSATPITTLGP